MPKALTAQQRTELLDHVKACQSAYHIDNTPGHRFGGLPSNLQENREALVDYVDELLMQFSSVVVSEWPHYLRVDQTPSGAIDIIEGSLPVGSHTLYPIQKHVQATQSAASPMMNGTARQFVEWMHAQPEDREPTTIDGALAEFERKLGITAQDKEGGTL